MNTDRDSIEHEETGSNRTGVQKTARPRGPMTVAHEQWDEFIERLVGADGCDCELANPDDSTSATWTCDCTDAFPVSRCVLREMGLTPAEIEESIAYFKRHGGFCDCEVFLNVDQFAVDGDDSEPAQAGPISPCGDCDGQ